MLGVDEDLETSSASRGSAKEPSSLQGEDHLVNARRGDGKERIPEQTGHRFRPKLDSDSGGNWTPIPEQSGQ